MSAAPRIPMRVEELPQQRVTLVVSLPARPEGFAGLATPPASTRPPARMPASARYIGQVEWAWSPVNTRIDAYYLSTNRARTHWFLWLRLFDDNYGRWDAPQIYACALKGKVDSTVAATYLLMDAWSADARQIELDRFHWINKACLLSVEELGAIGRVVWAVGESKARAGLA